MEAVGAPFKISPLGNLRHETLRLVTDQNKMSMQNLKKKNKTKQNKAKSTITRKIRNPA